MFGIKLNDTTNAFNAYRTSVIQGCRPLLSPHFNLTVELPLKTIVRGYSWTVMPITWRNRRAGVSKLALNEMGTVTSSSASMCGSRNISVGAITRNANKRRLPIETDLRGRYAASS
jgi:hypothetical protein